MGQLRDILNILRHINRKRLVNAFRIYVSYRFSIVFRKKAFHRGRPVSISVEPTTSCNLRCPECPSGLRAFSRPTGMLTADTFKAVIDDLSDTLLYLILYFQGEPYLNPAFFDLICYAKKKRVYTATSTNAHFLTPENAEKTVKSGLDRLIISMDGLDQQTYEKYRVGGQLNKVLEGTKNIVNAKQRVKSATPYIILQFLVFRHNEHQVKDIRKLGKELGVDRVELKSAQVYDYEKGSELIPEGNRFSRYLKGKNGLYSIKNTLPDRCWKMWHSCVVTWDGKVVPCCFDKDARYVMGDINEKSLSEIWKNKAYQQFRKKILSSRKSIDICRNCSER